MNDYYVILTGSKNNAGDFLIKHRAKELFNILRSDREIIDFNAWEKLDEKKLEVINGAKALILMGGPALQKDMVPNVYPLSVDLNEIKTKITMMGVGWKSLSGNWPESRKYFLSGQTKALLKRISEDGLSVSVRDYSTLNVLRYYNLSNVIMTGCPATYALDYFEKKVSLPTCIKKIGFSLGVSFLESKEMEDQMKKLIMRVKRLFDDNSILEVVFHHSTSESFLNTHNAKRNHLDGHVKFIQWLNEMAIPYVDISGSAENLMSYYREVDIHIGYRVHAHIYMNSISKPSILIAEDGRGKALSKVFGGVIIDGFDYVKSDTFSKILRKLRVKSGFKVPASIPFEVVEEIKYEINTQGHRMNQARQNINENYELMKGFITELP